jgi:molybdopterin synthase catalytic subunit
MAIVHRLGPVQIGEASVIIAVSSAHREAAFAASRFAIEEIKKVVPIWKKEVYEGGEVWIGTQTGQEFKANQ